MSDFRYDYEYASKMDDYKYYKDEYWGPIAASLEYLRSLKVGTTSCNHAKYHNSMIVSHTLYNIWKDVLKKDSDTFGQILFQSLYYLPSNADFSDFCDAFIYSMSKYCDDAITLSAAGKFGNAGIQTQNGNIASMKAKDTTVFSCFDMSYSEIENMMVWDDFTFYDSFEDPGSWTVVASKDDASLILYQMRDDSRLCRR